jgi:hypothetical protein
VRKVLSVLVLAMLGAPGVLARTDTSTQSILSVKDVMRRVAAYVDAYGERASIVVATERYDQEALTGGTIGPEHRQLLSDFAIVYVAAERGWQGYRDVLEVDGRRLPDRDDRLVRLLTDDGGRIGEARRLSDESARFNVGAIQRNFNVPTTALFFFTARDLDRFRFTARGVDADGVWEIEYRETAHPSRIRTPAGRSVRSSGRLWVNPADGTVLRTRLTIEGFADNGRRGAGRVDVRYEHIPQLEMWLPASMDEEFTSPRGPYRDRITGRAVYSNYRRFTTSVRIK